MITRRKFLGAVMTAAVFEGLRPAAAWATNTQARDRIRIGFLTDIHTRLDRDVPNALTHAATAINSCGADLLIAGGDFVNEGFDSSSADAKPRWDAARSFLDRLAMPVNPAIGNHDYIGVKPSDGSAPNVHPESDFLQFFGLHQTYRTTEIGGYHFIFLDPLVVTNDELRYHCTVSPVQLAWLKSDLKAIGTTAPIILVTHAPLLTSYFEVTAGSTKGAPANRVVTNNAEVLSLFENHNLLLVLQGHLHVNETIRWRSTTFITGGAICGGWWGGVWHGTEEGFGVITIEKNRIDWQYQGYGWHAHA